jgi:phospholipid transport system substrate-binding protein
MIPGRFMALVAALLLVAAALVPIAWAGEPADQLSAQIALVLKVVDDPELRKPGREQERRQALLGVAREILDIEEFSRRTLGRHWEARTAAEREEFMQLFGDLLERLYIGKLETYSDEKIMFLGDTTEGDLATVQTKIVTKQGTEIPVEYRMLRRGDRWRACDVVIGGISLVANYRAQFDKIIRRTSYQQLVKQVREKQ